MPDIDPRIEKARRIAAAVRGSAEAICDPVADHAWYWEAWTNVDHAARLRDWIADTQDEAASTAFIENLRQVQVAIYRYRRPGEFISDKDRFGPESLGMGAMNKLGDLAWTIERIVLAAGPTDARRGSDGDDLRDDGIPHGWREAALAGQREELLSIEQSAECIHKSERTVYRMMKDGLHYLQPSCGRKSHRRIRKSDLIAWMDGTHPDCRGDKMADSATA